MDIKHVIWMSLASLAMLATGSVAAQDTGQPAQTLVTAVRQTTETYQDVERATAAGYVAMSCVSGPQAGAMGVHYVDGGLVGDGELAADDPEALLYEMKDGQMQLLGVEYIVLAEDWDATGEAPPALLGQQFHYVSSPNRYGLPPFYELHVWAWQENPNGMFADWNPSVTCEEYAIEG